MDEGSELRLGRYIDYPNLIRTFVKYEVGFPFVEDRIDRSRPLDRILYNGQWFMSGYIISRTTKDRHKVYSQIIRIYPGSAEPYHVALLDLRRRPGFIPSDKFYPHQFEVEPARELVAPLSKLQFVDYTPTVSGYFNPVEMPSDQLEMEYLKKLKLIVDEQRQFENSCIHAR